MNANLYGRHALIPRTRRRNVLGIARKLSLEKPSAFLQIRRHRLIEARQRSGLCVDVEWDMETELLERIGKFDTTSTEEQS